MPKTITKTVYTFAELIEKFGENGKPTEKAREWLQQGATDHNWWDGVYDNWTEALRSIGFDDVEISFSGFWSQGDGASFVSKSIDTAKLLRFLGTDFEPLREDEHIDEENWPRYIIREIKGKPATDRRFLKLIRLVDYLEPECTRGSHHYSHERTCRFRCGLRDHGDCNSAVEIGKPGCWVSHTKRVRAAADAFEEAAEQLRLDICRAIYKDLEEEYEYRTADAQLIDDCDANDWTFDEDGRRDG